MERWGRQTNIGTVLKALVRDRVERLGASDQHWDCFKGTCEGSGGAPGGIFEHIDLDHLELNCSVSLLVNMHACVSYILFCSPALWIWNWRKSSYWK